MKHIGFILLLIFLVAFLLRFYNLGKIPNGFYQDESAIGYNAYSLLQTGKDEHGVSFPLYFKSFGDYKLPVYIYLTVVSVKIFGLNEFAVRLPSALFGFLSIVMVYLFVKSFTKNNYLSLVSAGLLAINPWSLHYNRATFEISVSLFLFLAGGFLMHKSLEKKQYLYFLLGTILFVVSLYTYNLTRLLTPLLYILFIFILHKRLRFLSKKQIIITGIISVVLLIPFFTTLFASGGVSSAKGTLLFSSSAVQAPLLEYRSYFIDHPLLAKLFFNKYILLSWQYISNVYSYLSMQFFFINGSTHGNHGIGNFGLFYMFEFIFMVFGIVSAIRKKLLWGFLLIGWVVIVILVASLTREVPHATRSFFLVAPLEIFSAYGLILSFLWLKSHRAKKVAMGILVIMLALMFYNVFYFFSSYYVRFPIYYAKAWRQQDKAVSEYIRKNESKYDKIIIDKNSGFIYSSLLFYVPIDSSEFQKTVLWEVDNSEGFSMPLKFGKYEFREVDWTKDAKTPRTLIVTTRDRKPNEVPPLIAFYYPKRPIVISLNEQLQEFPVEEIAYVLVESQ